MATVEQHIGASVFTGDGLSILPAFDALLGVVDEVLPIAAAGMPRAKAIVLGSPGLSARHAVHVAVLEQHGIDTILWFDRAFDGYPGIRRLRE